MAVRVTPQEYFMQNHQNNDNKNLIILGLIIMGIVACVAITAIALKGGKGV